MQTRFVHRQLFVSQEQGSRPLLHPKVEIGINRYYLPHDCVIIEGAYINRVEYNVT